MIRICAVIIISAALWHCGSNEQQNFRRPVNAQSSNNQPIDFPSNDLQPTPSVTPELNGCNQQYTANLASKVNASGNAIFVTFNLQADASVKIQGSDNTGSIALNAAITSFTPSFARPMAENILKGLADPLVLTFATGSERDEIYSNPNWQGLECIVLPVKSIRNSAYSYDYNPPIPFVVNPNATAEQLATIGNRTFPGINAKISKHPTARSGTYQGAASLSSTGSSVKIDFNFGGAAPRANSTPMKSVQYTIDTATKTYSETIISAFVADNSLIDLKVTK